MEDGRVWALHRVVVVSKKKFSFKRKCRKVNSFMITQQWGSHRRSATLAWDYMSNIIREGETTEADIHVVCVDVNNRSGERDKMPSLRFFFLLRNGPTGENTQGVVITLTTDSFWNDRQNGKINSLVVDLYRQPWLCSFSPFPPWLNSTDSWRCGDSQFLSKVSLDPGFFFFFFFAHFSDTAWVLAN